MRRAIGIGLVIGACASLGPAAGALPRDPRLHEVQSFAFAIGTDAGTLGHLERLAEYDLVVLDGVDAPTPLVDGLRARGVLVLAYLSVGTIETGRPWSAEARPYRLERWTDWREWYADVAAAAFRKLLTNDVAPSLLARGFDGIFLDNVDMVADHPRQRDGMYTLVRDLAGLVHSDGGFLFAQNGDDVVVPVLDVLDGWNREDVTLTYDFDTDRYERVRAPDARRAERALRRIGGAGLLVSATDYSQRARSPRVDDAISRACAAGAIPFVSDLELDRVPAPVPCG